MATFSLVPDSYDPAFIFAKAGLESHCGFTTHQEDPSIPEGSIRLGYLSGNEDEVVAAIDAYPVTYANEVQKADMLRTLAATRFDRQQSFTMGDATYPSDLTSLVMVNGAVLRLGLPGAPTAIRWKSPGGFVNLDLAALEGLGAAMADHIQACFDHEDALAATIGAAADIDALAAIDLDAGWPA